MHLIRCLLALSIPSISVANHSIHHQHDQQVPLEMSKSLNGTVTSGSTRSRHLLLIYSPVFKQPLSLHSTAPMTGFLRNGYCEVPVSDFGNHAVAAIVTDEFLDFSASKGNDLRGIQGMQAGCKWCLCASRWKEAFDARASHANGERIVPKVVLSATNEKALGKINLDDLKGFAVKED